MKIKRIRTLSGPNVFAHRPVLVLELDLEEFDERPSNEFPGFINNLLSMLPGLQKHRCSRRREGGFVERLNEGTLMGHIVEHVALELSELAGIPAFFGKTVSADEPRCYHVAVEFVAEQGMKFLLEEAVHLVEAAVVHRSFPVQERVAQVESIVARTELGPSTKAIVEAAQRRGIPWRRLNEASLIQLGYGKYRKLLEAALSSETSYLGVEIAGDKALTKRLLDDAFLPVPAGSVVRSEAEALSAWKSIGGPVVIKPLDGNQGKGVSMNITNAEEVVLAFKCAREFSPEVIVEEMFVGNDYRMLTINYKLVAAAEREPAHVIGDGVRQIAALIEEANRDPLRGKGHEKPLTQILVNVTLIAHLAKSGRTLETVPRAGEVVYLRGNANLSTGGSARDVTDLVHPDVAAVCEQAARVIGLDICGIDLIAPSIDRPLPKGSGIVELNASPGLRMHVHPTEGRTRPVADAVVEMLYPKGADGRIPIAAITGTNGKTTTARLAAYILGSSGMNVGLTTTDGIYVGNRCIAKGDMTGAASAKVVLSDPSVEAAVLETARGGIVRRGLGYDWSDVGVMLNIRPDHFGQDGIHDLEDLIQIKSLVAERVREGGTLVLNADDPSTVSLLNRRRVVSPEKRVVYFSLDPANPVVRLHLGKKGTAYLLSDGWIVEATGTAVQHIVEASQLPLTFGGLARFNIANALAAVASCRALGMRLDKIAPALKSFQCERNNPGRTNLYRIGNSYVLMDYAHNADAFQAVSELRGGGKQHSVIGVVGVPGDRTNELIEEAGRVIATRFDEIIIKQDDDRRGRRDGEVPWLLYQAIKSVDPNRSCSIILDEREAFRAALKQMKEDDWVMCFFDKLGPLLPILEEYGAVPAAEFESNDALREHKIAQISV